MIRTISAIALGFALGLCVGPLSPFAIVLRNWLRSDEGWPQPGTEILSWGFAIALFFICAPAGINGAIGAGAAMRRGTRERRSVTIFPAALHAVVAVASLLAEPRSFVGFQWYTLVFTVVIWSAGRLGQRIGCALYPGPKRG